MNDSLVLNRNFCAIHVISWQRAMSLLYQGAADAVDTDLQTHDFETWKELSSMMVENPSGFVNTVSFKIAVPEVIRLTRYDRLPRAEVKFTRRNIYQHYNYKCCYCQHQFKTQDLNLDHVVPKSKGGVTDWTNIVTACIACNTYKMDRTPSEAGMTLHVAPTKPKWKGSKSLLAFTHPVKQSWQRLLDSKYWDVELYRTSS